MDRQQKKGHIHILQGHAAFLAFNGLIGDFSQIKMFNLITFKKTRHIT